MAETRTKQSVVVIEDNEAANHLLRDCLKLTYDVTCFLDGESTLRQLPASATEAFVFIIDYNLGAGMNGIALKNQLTPLFPHGRYILVSGLFDETLLDQGRAAGFDVLLPKPFSMPTILRKVAALLNAPKKKDLTDLVRDSGVAVRQWPPPQPNHLTESGRVILPSTIRRRGV